MTDYQVTKTVTYTLVVSAQTPADAAIIADAHTLDTWDAWTHDVDVESLGPQNEEIDEY